MITRTVVVEVPVCDECGALMTLQDVQHEGEKDGLLYACEECAGI